MISVFISKENGQKIGDLVKDGIRVVLHITLAPHNNYRYPNINKTSVLFFSVSFAILMIISLAWLVFYYVQRFRYIHAKDILGVSYIFFLTCLNTHFCKVRKVFVHFYLLSNS